MNKIILFIFILGTCFNLQSQESWNWNADFADDGTYLPAEYEDTNARIRKVVKDIDNNLYLLKRIGFEDDKFGESQLQIEKVSSDGLIINSFGNNGFLTFSESARFQTQDMLILPEGEILVIGQTWRWMVLFKLNLDGEVVSDFGENGVLKIDLNQLNGRSLNAARKQNGDYYLFFITSQRNLNIYSIKPDGSLDPSFNFGGVVTHNTNGWDTNEPDFVLDSNDNIYCASYGIKDYLNVPLGQNQGYIFKIRNNGLLATAFGDNGWMFFKNENGGSKISSMAIDPGNNIYLGGNLYLENNIYTDLLKIDLDGQIDQSFLNNHLVFPRPNEENLYSMNSLSFSNNRLTFAGDIENQRTDEYNKNGYFGFAESDGTEIYFFNDDVLFCLFEFDWRNEFDDIDHHIFNTEDTILYLIGYNRSIYEGPAVHTNYVHSFKMQNSTSTKQVVNMDQTPVFPNPSNGIFTIDNTEGFKEWKLLDMDGKSLNKGKLFLGINTIEAEANQNGIFVLQLSDYNGKIQTQKLEIIKK